MTPPDADDDDDLDIDDEAIEQLCAKMTLACVGHTNEEIFLVLAEMFTVVASQCENIAAVDDLATVLVNEVRARWLAQREVPGGPQ